MTFEQVEARALDLPEEDRARLAQRLIVSLEEDAELVAAWYDEDEPCLAPEAGGVAEDATRYRAPPDGPQSRDPYSAEGE